MAVLWGAIWDEGLFWIQQSMEIQITLSSKILILVLRGYFRLLEGYFGKEAILDRKSLMVQTVYA